MRWTEEAWAPIAHTLGFANEQEMLQHLYSVQEFSISQISRIVGYSTFAVRRRLKIARILIRSKGGDNRTGKRYLKDVPSDRLFSAPIEELAENFQVHPSTIYAEKRFRLAEEARKLKEKDNELLPYLSGEVAAGADDIPGLEGSSPEVAHGTGPAPEGSALHEVLPDENPGG